LRRKAEPNFVGPAFLILFLAAVATIFLAPPDLYYLAMGLIIFGCVALVIALVAKQRSMRVEEASHSAFLMSRVCGVCNREVGQVAGKIRLFWTDPKVQNPSKYFHEACYREALRRQARRCPNCNTALYNPLSREFVVPVFLGDMGLLFCSQKCSESYKPLAGLAVAPPIETSCPYCKSIFSSSLGKCPNCGAARSKPTIEPATLTPFGFELRVAELLGRMGYLNVTRVGGAGDRAVDILAEKKDEFGRVLRYAVQCKRYEPQSHVGSQEMQVFCSMLTRVHGSDRGIYVTTSSFTPEALEIAQRFGVTVVDGRLLQELFAQYG
jgi:uncharacterized protein with PIN domain